MKKTIQEGENSFSLLMANYNNANFIETAIESVISQSYSFWELIIIDDCSTDNSIEIIKRYIHDNRIKLIQHKSNQGYAGSLRTAAQNASCNIIGIIDADDKLHEKALEKMNDAYQKFTEFGLIYSTMWMCDSNLENCSIDKTLGPVIPEKTSIFQLKISHFKTFRKDAYFKTYGFDPKQKKGVDKDIIFKLEEVCRLKFIDEPLYYYRQHPGGISQGKNEFLGRVYYYIAKCKAYQRRRNTKIPNIELKELYYEYFKITFHSLLLGLIKLIRALKVKKVIKKISEKSSLFERMIYRKRILKDIIERI